MESNEQTELTSRIEADSDQDDGYWGVLVRWGRDPAKRKGLGGSSVVIVEGRGL